MVSAVPQCPMSADVRKSARIAKPGQSADRRTTGFEDGRGALRDPSGRQAGFKAELISRFSGIARPPIIYLHGEAHRRQRSATARFFAPKVVATRYRAIMDATAERLAGDLERAGVADLDTLSLDMAVTIAADIVGLTANPTSQLAARLERLFESAVPRGAGWIGEATAFVRGQVEVLRFYRTDVRPAIAERRREPREDVISHLIAEGYSDREILTECMTYGAAGMVTTREFITMAGWHLLEQPELLAKFLATDDDGRISLLEEILRLEPVIGSLRRQIGDAVVVVDVRAANGDERAVGACPYTIDPARVRAGKVGGAGLSFGDGEHRCPGAGVALHESAVLLNRLLRLSGIRLEAAPAMRWNPLALGYELRGCRVRVDG